MTTRMQRSLKVLKEQDLVYWRCETWNSFTKRKIDVFNIIDILVLGDNIKALQICGSDYQSHVKKIRESEYTIPWLQAGGSLEIWSWRQYLKKRNMKAKEWRCLVADVLLVDGGIFVEELWK